MDWIDLDENVSTGAFILLYGDMGEGKTVSTLKSAPKRVLCAYTEPRDVRRTCIGNVDLTEKVDGKNSYRIGHFGRFSELKRFVGDEAKTIAEGYNTFIVDSISYYMNVILLSEIRKETSGSGIFKSNRDLVNELRTDEQGYAGLAAQMIDFCKVCKDLTSKGMVVIFIAGLQEDPKWDISLKGGPAFAGKEFGKNFSAFFDLIGLVKAQYDEDGNKVFPPLVSFDKKNEARYLAKWSGPHLPSYEMPLDWSEILRRGEK